MSLAHGLRPMAGRDPAERHRTSTPLELLFDLTFAVAFGATAEQTAGLLADGRWVPAFGGFAIGVFAVSWAWVNYSWLASAYDNDDVFFRLATLVEMLGVIIIALGVPQLFRSIAAGQHVDNAIMVGGYVVMRVAALALWIRAAVHDPTHRRACLTYALAIAVAQVGWVTLIFLSLPLWPTVIVMLALAAVELAGPLLAERKDGGTPWHPAHIAERYSLLVIVTLGEVILATVLAVSAVIDRSGWSVETILVAFGGTALAFGLWWLYFTVPSERVLVRHRERAYAWSYGHILIFAAIAGVGVGLRTAAAYIDDGASIGATGAILTVALPVLVFQLTLVAIYSVLLRTRDRFHLWIFAAAAVVLALAVVAVAIGASVGTGILIVAASPAIIVVAYETVGHRHEEAVLQSSRL